MKSEKEQLEHDLFVVTRLIYGNWMQQVTFVFAELGVADVLVDAPKSVDELAEALGVIGSYLNRFLRCASELGFVDFDRESQKYVLTPRGELLGSDHPNTKRDEARLNGEDYRYLPWSNLINIIKYGMKEEYSPTIKDGTLAYLQDKPELFKTFHRAMTKKSQVENFDIIKDFDFSKFTTVMDLGCGQGSFLKCILDNNTHMDGIMFDMPGTFESDVEPQYGARLSKVSGNFFESIPNTADVYTMKNIIHNWREFKTKNLLAKVREAMLSQDGVATDPQNKRFLVVENIVPENGEDHVANWMDLNFMVLIDGAERTTEEYRALGKECGFTLEAVHPTGTARHIIEYSVDVSV